MKYFSLAVLSGFFMALSFPDYFIPFVYLIGFFFLYKTIDTKNLREIFIFSFITGLSFTAFSFYWIVFALTYYGDVSIPAGIGLFIIFAGIFSTVQFVIFSITSFFLKKRYKNSWIFLTPFVWISIEIVREFFPFGGFPWNLLGYSISYINPLSQITSLFGIYSLSFIAISSAVVTYYFFTYRNKYSLTAFLFFLSGVILIYIGGYFKINNYKPEGIKKKVSIIQGNIVQSEKMRGQKRHIIMKYVNLIKQTKDFNPDLIVLPESSLPFYPFYGQHYVYKRLFFDNLSELNKPMLIGLDNVFFENDKVLLYNSLVLFNQHGSIVEFYNKMKLVPFGEYVPNPFKPFSKLFPYLAGYDFVPGKEQKIISFDSFKFIPLICFEAIFPHFVGSFSNKGNLIINVTNDAWFGKSPAPFQHFEMARVRAIENGKYLVRAANTGISAIINPVGEIEKSLSLFEDGVINGEIYLVEDKTFWTKYWKFIYLSFFLIFLIFILTLEIKNLRSKHNLEKSK